MRAEHRLDLGGLDAHTAELDLMIEPAEVLQPRRRGGSAPIPVRYSRSPARGDSPRTARPSAPGCGDSRERAMPPRYSSPATPIGTGRSRASSTYVCVFEIGLPIGTTVSALAAGGTATR